MLFKRKKLKMIWGIKGKGKTSYLIGTSHIFSHSFRDFLEYHISKTESVVIEGPLDKEEMEKVVKTGIQSSE
ncbi:TraB/GumN family protein, partial [Thermodesulfovibrio yellowstonii]